MVAVSPLERYHRTLDVVSIGTKQWSKSRPLQMKQTLQTRRAQRQRYAEVISELVGDMEHQTVAREESHVSNPTFHVGH